MCILFTIEGLHVMSEAEFAGHAPLRGKKLSVNRETLRKWGGIVVYRWNGAMDVTKHLRFQSTALSYDSDNNQCLTRWKSTASRNRVLVCLQLRPTQSLCDVTHLFLKRCSVFAVVILAPPHSCSLQTLPNMEKKAESELGCSAAVTPASSKLQS